MRNKNFTNIYNSGQRKTNVVRKARRPKTPQMRSSWKDREGFLGKVASERVTDNWRRKKEAAAHVTLRLVNIQSCPKRPL